MNQPSYFEIQAEDLDKAEKFYSAVFGWQFAKDPSLPIDYRRIQTQGMMGGLLPRQTKAPAQRAGTNAFVCSMQVENFDNISYTILQNGGQVALAKFAVTGKCWQGYFSDTEGNIFGIFEVDEKAK